MRLIDADELKKLFPDNGEGSWTYNITAKMYIDNAPTVNLSLNLDNITEADIEKFKTIWQRANSSGNPSEWSYNFCPKCGADMRGGEES